MSLKNITVELTANNQKIRGNFRALVCSSGLDVLILGNKKSSLLLNIDNIVIKSITIKHTGDTHAFSTIPKNETLSYINQLGQEKTVIETFEPKNKKQAYFLLTSLYIKYKNETSIIESDPLTVKDPYIITDLDGSNKTIVYNSQELVKHSHIVTKPDSKTYIYKRDTEPNLHSNSSMTEFLNEIAEGREYDRKQNYWKQGYSGQLINSS